MKCLRGKEWDGSRHLPGCHRLDNKSVIILMKRFVLITFFSAILGCDSGIDEEQVSSEPSFNQEHVTQQLLNRSAESSALDMAGSLAIMGNQVYQWDGVVWALEVEALRAEIMYNGEALGYPSAATDGERVILGTDNYFTEHCGNSYVGRALVFEEHDQQWGEATELISPADGALYCGSGQNVDIKGRLLLAKGLPFSLDPDTGQWTQIPRVGRLDIQVHSYPSRFQIIDDSRILISYKREHIIEIIEWTGTTWQTVASGSLAHVPTINGSYGPIAYSDNHLIVSARERAYIFALEDGVFAEVARLMPEEGVEETAFGTSVAIDGHFVAVSDPFVDAVYLYELVDTEWVMVSTFRSSDWPDFPEEGNFGPAMVLNERRIIIAGRGVSYSYAW